MSRSPPHHQLGGPRRKQLIDLAAETGRNQGLAYDPYHDWLPDVDLADLADQPALPANGA